MQWAMLAVLGAALGLGMRRIALLRRCGVRPAALRLYRRLSFLTGGGAWVAMAVQEAALLFGGQLTWRTGLPLHLCSVMGLVSLPALITRRRFLWHCMLFLGAPGALAALVFPAVAATPWPELTRAAFCLMHCCVLLAPLLPLSLGMRPTPRGAAEAGGALLLLALVASAANALTGGNYLFLNGSPIGWMKSLGMCCWWCWVCV